MADKFRKPTVWGKIWLTEKQQGQSYEYCHWHSYPFTNPCNSQNFVNSKIGILESTILDIFPCEKERVFYHTKKKTLQLYNLFR